MRIAWAIPCARVRSRPDGLLDLLGCQLDSVVLESLPTEIEFDVAIRLVGTEHDFTDSFSDKTEDANHEPSLYSVSAFRHYPSPLGLEPRRASRARPESRVSRSFA